MRKDKFFVGLFLLGLMLMMSSCVDEDLFEIFEEDSLEISKRTKQFVISNDVSYWDNLQNELKADYVANECVAWAMMKVFGLSDQRSLDKIRKELYRSKKGSGSIYTFSRYEKILESSGFSATDVENASEQLQNNNSNSGFRKLTKHEGITAIDLSDTPIPINTYIIHTQKNNRDHAGVIITYDPDNQKIHYEDMNDDDVSISCSMVFWNNF